MGDGITIAERATKPSAPVAGKTGIFPMDSGVFFQPDTGEQGRFDTATAVNLTGTAVLTKRATCAHCDPSGGSFQVTLPSSAGLQDCHKVVIGKIDSGANTVTVARGGSDEIEGNTTLVLSYRGSVTLRLDKTPSPPQWEVESNTSQLRPDPDDPPTFETFFKIDPDSSRGNFRVKVLGSDGGGAYCNFHVPHDFTAISALELIGIVGSGAAGSGKDIDLYSEHGAPGEAYDTHTEADTTSTYDLTGKTDVLHPFDISGVFSAIAAGDYCGFSLDHNTIGGSIYYLGIRLRYT